MSADPHVPLLAPPLLPPPLHPPARLPVLIWWDYGDVDFVCRAEQPGPLLWAQVNQGVSAEPYNASPKLQTSALSITEPLQLGNEAFLVHKEAWLSNTITQGGDLESLAAPGNQLWRGTTIIIISLHFFMLNLPFQVYVRHLGLLGFHESSILIKLREGHR